LAEVTENGKRDVVTDMNNQLQRAGNMALNAKVGSMKNAILLKEVS
jgi:hypothetical protein